MLYLFIFLNFNNVFNFDLIINKTKKYVPSYDESSSNELNNNPQHYHHPHPQQYHYQPVYQHQQSVVYSTGTEPITPNNLASSQQAHHMGYLYYANPATATAAGGAALEWSLDYSAATTATPTTTTTTPTTNNPTTTTTTHYHHHNSYSTPATPGTGAIIYKSHGAPNYHHHHHAQMFFSPPTPTTTPAAGGAVPAAGSYAAWPNQMGIAYSPAAEYHKQQVLVYNVSVNLVRKVKIEIYFIF